MLLQPVLGQQTSELLQAMPPLHEQTYEPPVPESVPPSNPPVPPRPLSNPPLAPEPLSKPPLPPPPIPLSLVPPSPIVTLLQSSPMRQVETPQWQSPPWQFPPTPQLDGVHVHTVSDGSPLLNVQTPPPWHATPQAPQLEPVFGVSQPLSTPGVLGRLQLDDARLQ